MRDLEACPRKLFLKKTSDENTKAIVMYYFTKKSNFRTFKFWPKCYIDSLREREETVERSSNFVRPTEIFEISRVFLPKEVQGLKNLFELSKSSRD